jgi:hypothetical protein
MSVPGSPRSTQVIGGSRPANRHRSDLHAWLYDVALNGISRPTWTERPVKVVPPTATLAVSIETVSDTPASRHLQVPAAIGMATEPVWVSPDDDTGYWKIRNRGRTNTLRAQPYGLRAVPCARTRRRRCRGPTSPYGSQSSQHAQSRRPRRILPAADPARARAAPGPGPNAEHHRDEDPGVHPRDGRGCHHVLRRVLVVAAVADPACPKGKRGQGDRRKVRSVP